MVERLFGRILGFYCCGKTFQNLKVSSPAPVTIVYPVGFILKNKTRLE